MAEYTCPGCGRTTTRLLGSSCARCGTPYAETDSGQEQSDLRTVIRSATSVDRLDLDSAPTPGFLAPPVLARTGYPPETVTDPAAPPEPNSAALVERAPAPQVPAYANYPVDTGMLRSSAPTVIITFLFGLFGIAPALIQTANARGRGIRTNKYWKAFWITMAVSFVLYILLLVALFSALAGMSTTV